MNILGHVLVNIGMHFCCFYVDFFFLALRGGVEVNIFVNVSCTFCISIKYILRSRIAGSNGMHRYILSRYAELLSKNTLTTSRTTHCGCVPLLLPLSVTQTLLLCLLGYEARLMKTQIFFLALFRHFLVGYCLSHVSTEGQKFT